MKIMKTTPLLASPLKLAISPRACRTPNSASTSHSCPSLVPPPLTLSASVMNLAARSADTVRSESFGSLSDVRRYVAYSLRPDTEPMIDLMRGGLSTKELYEVMRRMARLEADEIVDALACHHMRADRYVAKLSSRFEAVVTRWEGRFIWFTRIEQDTFAFALSSSTRPIFKVSPRIEPVRRIILPERGITWQDLQQYLVDAFADDNHVRAILAACLLSCDFDGKYNCVVRNLVPDLMRCLPTCITFDVPIDEDILTVIANARSDADGVYFDCAGGFCARLQCNSQVTQQYVSHLEPLSTPVRDNLTEVTVGDMCLPFLYGFGESLNCQNPTSVNNTRQILEMFDGVQSEKLKVLLKLLTKLAPRLTEDRKLDLTAGVNVLRRNGGTILSKTSLTRRIRGDVILIRDDGLYRSSRFKGDAVSAFVEVNALIVRIGARHRKIIEPEDKPVRNVSEVASYLLGSEYTPLFTEEEDLVLGPPDDPWGDDTAIANSIAVLLCRTYGPFTGHGRCAYKPWAQCRLNTINVVSMNADVFLPMLHAFEDPVSQIEHEFWALYCIWCLLTCFIFIDVCRIAQPFCNKNLHDQICTKFLHRSLYRKEPLIRRVGERILYLNDNPFAQNEDATVVDVYATL